MLGVCMFLCVLQQLLRGVVPGSFPFALGPEPQQTAGIRRLIVIDDNVHRLYGELLRKVSQQASDEGNLIATAQLKVSLILNWLAQAMGQWLLL